MAEETDMPYVGEAVVCKVTKVLGYGAFVELVEYDNAKGFVHISQIASSWIKNIRNHVREGQVRAAKVLSFNREKNQIDLSLAKVSSQAQRSRIEEWKQLKRSKKLIELLAKKGGSDFDTAWDAIARPLLDEFDSLQEAFQQIALKGAEPAKAVESKWRAPLVALVKKSVAVPERTVKGAVELHSFAPNGVEVVKEALAKGAKAEEKSNVEIFYVKGGRYAIRATANDFKSAKKRLCNVADAIVQAMEAKGGEAKFEGA